MTTTNPAGTRPLTRSYALVGKLLLAAVLVAAVTLMLLALAGVFHGKVPMETAKPPPFHIADQPVAEVRKIRLPRYETAVGTVRPVYETAVASKLLARVVEVKVKAGQAVTRDEVLVRLDDAELQARLKQAEAALSAAKSAHELASIEFRRAQQLLENRAIARAEYDQFESALRTATANLERAQQAVQEAKVLLDYATIRAPMTGIVIDKRVEAGDTVAPGQILLTIYDPTRMQMVVTVRESLAERLKVGQKVRGRLEALGYECDATVSEIVPEAQAASRSFTVKVTGPCPPGVYSGMFGRIYIPLDEEEIVVVPEAAVVKVGQLDMVDVLTDRTVQRRSVQLGRRFDSADATAAPDSGAQGLVLREVLAGLAVGEKVVLQQGKRVSQR
ncbi:MAG: efflux RND transporter periplasmic adaptor subunit [Gemmatales bacterium]|nr:efflux RND transporter periplasmic adaptor subunit [Gemmatales bacterium]MDW8387234.1 efflux RND transporter periplasmic adaptor subunit [Gemmatales bacterium]